MIRVVHDDDKCILTVCGHANYAEKGKDIVCAAASSLVYSFIRYCNRVEKYDNGLKLIGNSDSSDTRVIFDAVVWGLKILEDSYPKNVLVTLGNLNDDTQERLQKG